MVRNAFSITLVVVGVLLVGYGVWGAAQPAVALAQPPRPTLTPQARPTLTPVPPTPMSATAGPTDDDDDDDDDGDEVVPGRITGTVIDANTGAPIPGITVSIGETSVTTDANGNYDLPGLPPGSYVVQLRLTSAQGTPLQAPIIVALNTGATVIQHLNFRGLMAAVPVPTTAPTSAPAPALPTQLPQTGGDTSNGWWAIVGIALLVMGLGLTLRGTRRA